MNTRRMLTPDGRSQVVRIGARRNWLTDQGHTLLTVSWPVFFLLVAGVYLAVNVLFAGLYLAGGNIIDNAQPGSFRDAFFFSVQTMATIGYGRLVPVGLMANILVTVEALIGMLGLALAAGLMYARFARPTAGVMFSPMAVITPFEGRPTLMLRIANQRANQILEAKITLVLVRDQATPEGEVFRRFYDLEPVRRHSPVFAMSWTVMHTLDEASPLYGLDEAGLAACQGEILVLFSGFHEAFAHDVHARRSYTFDEILWGRRFADMFVTLPDGRRAIDLRKFDQTT